MLHIRSKGHTDGGSQKLIVVTNRQSQRAFQLQISHPSMVVLGLTGSGLQPLEVLCRANT